MNLVELSKEISYALRHAPWEYELELDEQGFVPIAQLLHALNELSRLAAQYSDVNCTTEDINFYLERIARGTPIAKKAAQMSNEDLEQYLQSMREKKQGTLPAED